MNKNPLVSIIIPVYNDAEFLHESLDSAVNQTLKDIEIICVNDASTDNSLEILNEYAAKDKRVRVINRSENGSALMARKDGVMAAKGDFTMFMDQDDFLIPNACETAYNLIVKNDVDILCFSYNLYEYAEDGSVLNVSVQNPSFNKFLYGREEIQNLYFIDNKTNSVVLWDKIFKTELLKLAHSKMEVFYCLVPNDFYADYYISYYAKKMLGLSTEPLYNYYFGRGVTGNGIISLEKFEKICMDSQGSKFIRNFLEREGTLKEQEKYLSGWRKFYQRYCCINCCKRVKQEEEEFAQAVKILYRYFNERNDTHEIILNSLRELCNHINWADDLEKANEYLLAQIQMNNEKNNDVRKIILHSLTELRNRINQAANLEKTNKNLLTKIQIDNENKNARIKELQDWSKEQLKAKEWFLSQIKYKDERIADLEKYSGFCYKILSKIFRILRGKN